MMNVAGVTVGDVVPGLPLRSDGRRKVTSGLIQLADCAFTPIASPATTALDMNGHALDNVSETQLAENAAPTTPHQRPHHLHPRG